MLMIALSGHCKVQRVLKHEQHVQAYVLMFFTPVFCRVVSAVFYGLESFSHKVLSEATNEGTTCMERLQEWNRPRSKKCAPKKATEMDFRKSSLGSS